jgi:hypothetical protein
MPNPNPNYSTRFQPGQSGNPAGRPPGSKSIAGRLKDLLERAEISGKPIEGGKQVADLVADVIVERALKGDFRFMDLLVERVDGKVVKRIEVESAGQATADAINALIASVSKPPEETDPGSTDRSLKR